MICKCKQNPVLFATIGLNVAITVNVPKNVIDTTNSRKRVTTMPNKYIGKIIISKDGLKGKCIGYLPKAKGVIIQHDKGGRIAYVKEGDIYNVR